VASDRILFQDNGASGMQLQDPQQGAASYHPCFRTVASRARRIELEDLDLHRPLCTRILHDKKATQCKAGLIGQHPIMFQLPDHVLARKAKYESGCSHTTQGGPR
jgi:hypothetical protein